MHRLLGLSIGFYTNWCNLPTFFLNKKNLKKIIQFNFFYE